MLHFWKYSKTSESSNFLVVDGPRLLLHLLTAKSKTETSLSKTLQVTICMRRADE